MSAMLTGCDTTQSGLKQAAIAARKAEEARMRAELVARIHDAETDVWNVLDPMIREAAGYRPEETFGYIGAVFVTEHFYSELLEREVNAEGIGSQVSILMVFPGSPAEEAGLRAGDRLISINGVKAPKGERGAVFALKKVKRHLKPGEMNLLEVDRAGELFVSEVEAIEGAYYGVIVVAGNTIDLHADGDAIWIGLSVVESMANSEDLSYICAYALAKNVMRQSRQKGRNSFLGQVVDIAAAMNGISTGGVFGNMGAKAYENSFDVESDLIALYLLASSGANVDAYPEFWERVLLKDSSKGELDNQDVERLDMQRRVIARIEEKRAAGEPLFPEEYLSGDASELEISDSDPSDEVDPHMDQE